MEGNPLRPSTRNVEERQESEYANYGSLPKGWMLAQISDFKTLTFLHENAYFHVFCYKAYGSDINPAGSEHLRALPAAYADPSVAYRCTFDVSKFTEREIPKE